MLNRDTPIQTCNSESLGKKSPPIQHFHCSTFRHCKLLFANLSRTNFSICYKLPQILKLLQISWRDCIFARAYRDISRCTCYLFVRLWSKCPPATHFGNFWSQDLGLSNYALQAYIRSKYQMFCASLEPRKAKEVDLQDFSFVAKSGGVCASRQGAALQSLFICLPRQQNLICNQFNRKVSPRKLSLCDNFLELE